MRRINKHNGIISLSLVFMVGSGCASSGNSEPDGEAYASSGQVEGDPERIVCRREKDTGSRLSTRTCKTARDWEMERELNQEMMRNRQRDGQGPSDMPSAGGN